MKKSISRLILIIIFTFFMQGCSAIEIIELNERLIIEAIGIDFENDEYIVTIEGLDSFSAGSDTNSISAPSLTKCFEFRGKTIGMAMNSISVITGQVPLFSQARVLIVGKETAEQKLSEVLDFFRREYTTRTDILFAVAESKAKDVVSANYGQNVSSGNIIEAAIESSKHTGTSYYMPLYKFINSVLSETDTPFCPVISTKNNPFTEKKEVLLSGTIILGNNSSLIITPEETLGLAIINNKIRNGDVTVSTSDGLCTLEIIDCKTNKSVEIIKNKAEFNIKIKLRCDIPEYQSENFVGLSKSDIEEIAELASEKITALTSDVINEIFFNKNEDIFNFGRLINLKDNRFFSEHYLQSNSQNADLSCTISVELSIRRIGKITIAEDR